jgi:DNA-binding NtrC family response regulator
MEDIDGIRHSRSSGRCFPGLKVIMLTGHGSERAAREGLSQGAFDYLMKPVDLEAAGGENQRRAATGDAVSAAREEGAICDRPR